jgi:dynein heavy chain
MGKLLGFERDKNIFDVSLGQGQDIIADAKLEIGHKEGCWIILQNIHLMPGWCRKLEKTLDRYALEGSNVNFRLFLTADPNPEIPISLLERSIKLTNESPSGLKANMKKAFASQKEEVDEKMETKVKCIYFGLCYFHSCLIERKKFGPKGFNMGYPFNIGDLRDSYRVLGNYMETAGPGKIPWDDLKYIFGEIMYGGHVVDDWDRRLVAA